MREIEGVEDTDHASLFKREGLVLQMSMVLKQICNHPAQFLKNRQKKAHCSGKAMMLLALVQSIVENGERDWFYLIQGSGGIVIILEDVGVQSMFCHGGCTLKKRAEMVGHFQTQHSAQVFVLSLKSAGIGLKLTAVTNVIHFDLWWNPAVEAQATDRAYRIEQRSNVQIHRFITKETFEEKSNAMTQDRQDRRSVPARMAHQDIRCRSS